MAFPTPSVASFLVAAPAVTLVVVRLTARSGLQPLRPNSTPGLCTLHASLKVAEGKRLTSAIE